MDRQQRWVTGHQPVCDFHTGLLAKVWQAGELGGAFFLHDLDTLEERGAYTIFVPTPHGRQRTVKLLELSKKKRKHLFSYGPVYVADYQRLLFDMVATLAGKSLKPELPAVQERLAVFQEVFPPGKEFESVASFTLAMYQFLFPCLGIKTPQIYLYSDMLCQRQAVLAQALEVFGEEGFWALTHGNARRPLMPGEGASLLAQGRLIPKALPICWIERTMGHSLIGGKGQAQYESSEPRLAELLKATSTLIVTSQQGLPGRWGPLAPGFRPSALLLWLLGGKFDPKQIIVL